MKKQKVTQPVAETRSTAENDLSFVVVTDGTPGSVEHIMKNVVGPLTRSRSEATLIIFGDSPLAQQAEVVELISKGRCRIGTDDAEIASGKGAWVYVIDDAAKFNLNPVLNCFTANKRNFTGESIYTGRFNTASGKIERSFGNRIKTALYNVVAQILLPSAIKDHAHPYHFFHKNIAASVWSESCRTQEEMLSYAAYTDKPVKEFSLTQKETQGTKPSLVRLTALAFTIRFKWFVTDAIRDLKRPAELQREAASRLGFAGFCLFALIAMCVLSFDFGISWDARRHNEYGQQMLKYFTTMGDDTTCLAENSRINEFRFYGEHFNVVAAFLNSYVSPFGEFETRHLLNALYGFLAMLFAALSAKEIGSWRTGLLGFLCIFFSPVFFGHSMNNPTDIPFAAGCSMAVYYLIKILKTLPAPKFSHLLLCAFGIGMAIGARVGGIVMFGYVGLFMGIQWLTSFRKNGWKQASTLIFPYVKIGVVLILMGFLFGLALWPFGQQHPLTNWYVALKRSTDATFFTYNHELFEGVRMYMGDVPWYYLPKFILMNSPLYVPVGFMLVLALSFLWKKAYRNWIYIPMVLFVLVFPIVYAEFQSMYYYNGWRHYLFVYPPLIVLTATGWDALMRVLPKKGLRYGIAVLFLAFLSLPAYWMIKNHPNECVYFNEAMGGVNGAYGNYETDYYSNSVREAAEWLAHHEPGKKVVVAINNEPLTGSYYATRINPKMEFIWVREYEEQRPEWDYLILTSRTFSKNEMIHGAFPPKGTIYRVMADTVPLAVVVKRENNYMPMGYKYIDKGNTDSAIYFFNKAIEYNPADEEAYRMIGTAYMNRKSFDTAQRYFDKSIELFPENYLSWDNKGLIYLTNKEYDKAMPFFKKAIHYKFNNTEGYYYTAVCEYSKGNYAAGIPYLENAIKRNGAIYQTYYYLGLGYLNTGNYNKAQEAFGFALAYNPRSADTYLALAEVFKKQGKQQEYNQCMESYRQLGGR